LPSVTLSFNLAPGVALGDAVGIVEGQAAALLPATITTSFQGSAQAFQESFKGLGLILLMAIFVIYVCTRLAVRELHSSADDSLGLPPPASVRWSRCCCSAWT
jgi:multidrug efflux pump subunit AcrB